MIRERILLYGGPGSGKSFILLRVIQYFLKKNPRAQAWIIDTEIGFERSVQEFELLKEIHHIYNFGENVKEKYPSVKPDKRVHAFTARNLDECIAASKIIRDECRKDDWVGIDMADSPWELAQEDFIEKIFDMDIGEYFIQARKKMKADAKSLYSGKDPALKGWADWPVIKARYNDYLRALVYRVPSHLIMTASAKGVEEDAPEDVKSLYGSFGVRPNGEKTLSHKPDTVLLCSWGTYIGEAYWMLSTIKDRGGRKYLDHKEMKKFELEYGKMIAGWA